MCAWRRDLDVAVRGADSFSWSAAMDTDNYWTPDLIPNGAFNKGRKEEDAAVIDRPQWGQGISDVGMFKRGHVNESGSEPQGSVRPRYSSPNGRLSTGTL